MAPRKTLVIFLSWTCCACVIMLYLCTNHITVINKVRAPINCDAPKIMETSFNITKPNAKCPEKFQIDHKEIEEFSKVKQVAPKLSQSVDNASILVLTPVSNSARDLRRYFSLLCSLSYPHHLLSIGLGEDSSSDNTYTAATSLAKTLRDSFESISVFQLSKSKPQVDRGKRHDEKLQRERRSHIALSRNQLLSLALRDHHDYVLWIDSDLSFFPPNIIQLLLGAKEDIVVPACWMRVSDLETNDVYDRNTWKETNESRVFLKDKPDDFLMLEGYHQSKRKYLSHLRTVGIKVPVDGVGGCMILIRALCHRKGLIFPPFVYNHHIETEGLAKMATSMGFSMYGLPFVNIFHSL